VLLESTIEGIARYLGTDGSSYTKLITPLVKNSENILKDILRPLHFPEHPLLYIQFGRYAFRSVRRLTDNFFEKERTKALFAGLGSHSVMPLDAPFTATFSLMLGMLGHSVSWPIAERGSQAIADALSGYFQSIGGQIQTGATVKSLDDVRPARAILLDITPKQLLALAADEIQDRNLRRYQRFKYGPGVFKLDWALDSSIPWQASESGSAATVHVGGTINEIMEAEEMVWHGKYSDKPFVILAQQSLFDRTRVPDGKHTAWGYCHVPNGSVVDMTERIEAQIERFAPGFRECIIGRHVMSTADLEEYNPNYVGGDIGGGAQDFWQLFAKPALRFGSPYATPIKGVYLCSSSTPPGAGVHGMCKHHAALAALHDIF
jgi:phytoene dehydrogenase-like protein